MHKTTYAVEAAEQAMKLISGKFTTNSTSDPDGIEGAIDSVTRSGVGTFAVALKSAYYFPSTGLYWLDVKVLGTAGTKAIVKSITTSSSSVTGFTMEIRSPVTTPAAAAWTTGVSVTSHTATLGSAGYVIAVDSTTGSATGGMIVQSQGSPAQGFVQVAYSAGIATLTFNATDAVTEAAVLVLASGDASEDVADTNNEDVYMLMYARNSKLTTR